jgi:hypothetical protein
MFPRLLTVLCALSFVPQSSVTQQSGTAFPANAPESCAVTKPYDRPFVPPFQLKEKQDANLFWFGTDRLWTRLPSNGTWSGLPHYTSGDPTFRQKLFFGRQGFDAHQEPLPRLTVIGRRLDSPAPPLLADRATSGWTRPDDQFMVVGINFPTLGCWQITGRYEDDQLTFVVWVSE